MKRKSIQGAPQIALFLGIGVVAGLMVSMIVSAVGAGLIAGQKLDEGAMGYCAWIAILLGSMVAALIGGAGWVEKWWLMCLAAGGAYYLCLLCCTALFFGGQYDGVGVGVCMCLGGSGACALLSLTRNGRPTRRKYGAKIRRFV